MIVQCDKCKTKFRIADEKVAASGVKVRCSRCAHVFMVQRDPTLLPPAPSTSEVDRALAGVGLGLPSDGNIPTVATAIPTSIAQHTPHSQQHSPLPSFPESLGGARPRAAMAQMTVPANHTPSLGMSNPFENPNAMPNAPTIPNRPNPMIGHAPTEMYPVPSLVPSAATTKDAMIALGFASAPQDDHSTHNFDEEMTARGSFTAASLLPPDKKKLAFDDLESQNRFPSPAPISTFDELFGREPPTQVHARQAQSNFETVTANSNPALPALPAQQDGPISSPTNDPLRPASAIDTIRSSPGLTALKSNPEMRAQQKPTSNPQGAMHTPKSNPALFSHTPPRSNPALNALAAAEIGAPPADPLTSPFFPPPTGIPGLNTHTNLEAIMRVQNGGDRNAMFPPPTSSQDLGDIPGLMPHGATDDPFAGLDLEGPQYHGGDLGEDSQAETRAVSPNDVSTPHKPLAKIELGRAGMASQFETALATTRVSTSLLDDGDVSTADLARAAFDTNTRWPTMIGLVVGLGITIAALIGPAGGDLSQLGPEDVVSLVSPPMSEPIDISVKSVEPKNAQVTLYPGKNGKQLLVVAGEAYNDGDQPITGLEAVAMVLSGKEVVEQREGWVGLTLEEDALSTIGTPAELEVALADAARTSKVPLDQRAIAPKEAVPFMVIFPDPPTELESRAFHVEFRRGTMSATRSQ